LQRVCVMASGEDGQSGRGAQKNLRLCRANAFENPLLSEGASRPDFGSHYGVGLQAPNERVLRLPYEFYIGSSKVTHHNVHRRGIGNISHFVPNFKPIFGEW